MKKLSILLCLLTFAACNAATDLSGIVDPSYKGNFQTHKMVVMGFGMQIDEQRALENTFEQSLIEYNVAVLRGLEVFPPTRNYSDKDIYEIAKSKGADTLLIVSADGHDISETYIPPTYHPGTSRSYIYGYGNFATVNTYTTPGYISGGYSVSKPRMNVSVHLKNTKNKETIWTAGGFSRGNAFASFSDLAVSIAATTVEELSKEDLIPQKKALEEATEVSSGDSL